MTHDVLDSDHIQQKPKGLFRIRVVIIWLILVVTAIIFRTMDWPGGAILLLFSTAGLQAYIVNGFIRPNERNPIIKILGALGIFWLVFLLSSVLFLIFPIKPMALVVYSVVFVIYFVVDNALRAGKCGSTPLPLFLIVHNGPLLITSFAFVVPSKQKN